MSSRVSGALLTFAAAPMFVVLLAGVRAVSPILLLAVVPLVVVTATRRRAPADPGWTAASRPMVAPGAARPSGSPTLALARVEGRELLLNPAFAAGAGISLLLYVVLALLGAADQEGPWEGLIAKAPFAVHPLLGFIALAVHLGVTRSRRHGCDELFDACPLDRDDRIGGHLGTAPLAVALVLVYVVLFLATVAVGDHHLYGPASGLVPNLLACAVLGAGAVALGCATGRWLPWAITPVLALVAIAWFSEWAAGSRQWQTRRYLGTADVGDSTTLLFVRPPLWSHALWLVAFAAVLTCLAVVRGRRWAIGGLAVGVVVATVAAVLVVQPIADDDARQIAALIAEPVAHQACVPVGGMSICAYRRYRELAVRVADEVRPVVAAIPRDALDGVRFVQLPPIDRSILPAEVIRELDARDTSLPAGVRVLGFHSGSGDLLAMRLRVAAVALGAPDGPGDGLAGMLAGQSRGVVLLWLATRGLSLEDALELAPLRDTPDPNEAAGMWPTACGRGGALSWSRQDFRAARALFGAPAETVAAVLAAGWDRFADPRTTTDALLDELGLARVGPPDAGIRPVGYSC